MALSRALASFAMLAACWREPIAPTITPDVVPIAPMRARLNAHELHGTAALADGGVVVVGGEGTCPPERDVSVTRFAAGGRVAWERCLISSRDTPLVAASANAIWIVHQVDPNAPDHAHGALHDLAVVERLAHRGRGEPRCRHAARTARSVDVRLEPANDPDHPCDAAALIGPPLAGVDRYDDEDCRRTVVLESAIEVVAW